MRGNSLYANAEAYALEILQQKMLREAQRSAQQTLMELSTLKSFLGQGQFVYCLPLGGVGPPDPPLHFPYIPFNGCINTQPCVTPELYHPTPQILPPQLPTISGCHTTSTGISYNPNHTPAPPNRAMTQSVVKVNVKNGQSKLVSHKSGLDECNLSNDGIDVTIDLKEYIPAQISLNVDEKVLEITAIHNDAQGSKTFARRYDLPACIILDTIKCILTHDGILMFSAAWCKME